MQEEETKDSKIYSVEEISNQLKDMETKSKQNVMHATIMAKFYRHQEEQLKDSQKEAEVRKRGQLGLKASQLEDTAELESEFLKFIPSLDPKEL